MPKGLVFGALGVALVGCRAVLGIEDPPSEAGSATSSGASASGVATAGSTSGSTTGSGGAPSSSGGSTTDDAASGSSASGSGGAGGSGAGPGSGGAGGDGPGSIDHFLDDEGVRLAWDEGDLGSEDDGEIYAVDAASNFWAFSPDLSSIERCLVAQIAVDRDEGGYFAGSARDVVYNRPGVGTAFLSIDGDPDAGSPCVSYRVVEGFPLAGVIAHAGTFYGVGANDAALYTFDHSDGELTHVIGHPDFIEGRSLAIKGDVAFGIATHDSSAAEVLTFDLEKGGKIIRLGLEAPGSFDFVAVAGSPLGVGYAWRRLDAGGEDQVVRVGGEFPGVDYEGMPSFDADEKYIYMATKTGLVICDLTVRCARLGAGGGRVNDVKATTRGLFVLQRERLRRFDPMTAEVFDTLPTYL